MNSRQRLAIIGSGPSAIYLLKHLLDEAPVLIQYIHTISIFEKGPILGMGMPYNPRMTDRYNMSNIASEELPELPVTFVDWLRGNDRSFLSEMGIEDAEISESAVYPRLALGRYFEAQYRTILAGLDEAGFEIREIPSCEIADICRVPLTNEVLLKATGGEKHGCDRVVIATGHFWVDEDKPMEGFYASPWPISKLLPEEGQFHDFTVGTLGASLSAFDVISSLAHRHGKFSEVAGKLEFHAFPGTENFRIVMHSAEGLLPHLQFDQEEPLREIYRHAGRDEILALADEGGFLRLATYFDRVCRPALCKAFARDGMAEMVSLLEDRDFGYPEFVKMMTREHAYQNAFEGMRQEMSEARRSVLEHRPIHWKEVIDDLIYTLNFHAELMPAEDHVALRSVVMPFLMNVVAAMPLGSGDILLALYDAGKLDLVAGKVEIMEKAGNNGDTTIQVENGGEMQTISYRMFVDCSGQKPLELEDYPFQGLIESGHVRRARARFIDQKDGPDSIPEEKKDQVFRDGSQFCYPTGGLDVDGAYRLVAPDGMPQPELCDIAFPHTSGVRPYSYGLQACSDTGAILVRTFVEEFTAGVPVDGVPESMTEIYEDLQSR